jgi:prevent-host-death family protein
LAPQDDKTGATSIRARAKSLGADPARRIIAMDESTKETRIGAYDAKTRLSELIARAEKGESFVVTTNGRPEARITPMATFDHEEARRAGEGILARLARAPRVSEEEAQRNWEELKADIDGDRQARIDRWLKSTA